MMNKTNDILQNQVELLKQALLFYAEKNNYRGGLANPSQVDLDEHGSQARFALDKLKEIELLYDEMDEDLFNYMSAFEGVTTNQVDLFEELKKLMDDTEI